MKRFTFSIFLLLIVNCINLQTSAQNQVYNYPMESLETMKFGDTSKQLNEEERKQLVRVITKKFLLTTQLKMDNDLTIERTDIGTVLLTNFPLLKERQKERGISLREIVRFFNLNSNYRKVINEVLVKQKLQKCS